MEVLQNPVVWRALERLLMVAGGVVLAIIGYRLFMFGIFGTTKDGNDLSALNRVMLGTGPGLFFMGFGTMVLITAVVKGGVSSHSVKDAPSGPISAPQIDQKAPQEMGPAGEESGSLKQSESPPPAGAASEVLWKKAAVNDGENNALVGSNFATLMQDFTPFLLAPGDGYVLKALGEESIHRHAITEFEKKVQNWSTKSPPPMSKSDLLPSMHPRWRPK